MRRVHIRRLAIPAAGFGLLLATLAGSASVGAAPPQIFTNNGCAVGNYTCLQDAGVTFNHRFPFGGAYVAPYVAPAYAAPYVAPAYITPYVVPATAAATGLSATIMSGTTSVSPGAVAVGQLVTVGVGGFAPGESVIATITGPNGQSTQIGPAAAAGDGTVTVAITFPAAGSWQMTVHGQTSNRSVGYQFTAQ